MVKKILKQNDSCHFCGGYNINLITSQKKNLRICYECINSAYRMMKKLIKLKSQLVLF